MIDSRRAGRASAPATCGVLRAVSANPDVAALVRARWRPNETSTARGIAAPRVVAADHVLRNGTAATRGCDQASAHWVRLSPASDCKRPIEFRPTERRKARSATAARPLSIGATSADRGVVLLCGFYSAISIPNDWTGRRLEYRSFCLHHHYTRSVASGPIWFKAIGMPRRGPGADNATLRFPPASAKQRPRTSIGSLQSVPKLELGTLS